MLLSQVVRRAEFHSRAYDHPSPPHPPLRTGPLHPIVGYLHGALRLSRVPESLQPATTQPYRQVPYLPARGVSSAAAAAASREQDAGRRKTWSSPRALVRTCTVHRRAAGAGSLKIWRAVHHWRANHHTYRRLMRAEEGKACSRNVMENLFTSTCIACHEKRGLPWLQPRCVRRFFAYDYLVLLFIADPVFYVLTPLT